MIDVDLAGWTGSAIIVEAPTGITYRFRPDYDSEAEQLIEGFWLPVSGLRGIPHDREARITGVIYERYCDDDPLTPFLDNSRETFMEGHLAVNTRFGPGWLIWKDAGAAEADDLAS